MHRIPSTNDLSSLDDVQQFFTPKRSEEAEQMKDEYIFFKAGQPCAPSTRRNLFEQLKSNEHVEERPIKKQKKHKTPSGWETPKRKEVLLDEIRSRDEEIERLRSALVEKFEEFADLEELLESAQDEYHELDRTVAEKWNELDELTCT